MNDSSAEWKDTAVTDNDHLEGPHEERGRSLGSLKRVDFPTISPRTRVTAYADADPKETRTQEGAKEGEKEKEKRKEGRGKRNGQEPRRHRARPTRKHPRKRKRTGVSPNLA